MINKELTKEQIDNLTNLYLTKSKEAFLLAVEIMNKPTINYRIECYAFLICNAWELLLKCFLIKSNGLDSIYYNKEPEKTISLSDCIKKYFPNEKNSIRCNLEFIINNIRDVSTHSVLISHEHIYMPILQASAINYIKIFNEVLGDTSLNNINLFYWTNLQEDIDYKKIEEDYGINVRQILYLSQQKKEEYIYNTLDNQDDYFPFAEITINYSRLKNNNVSDIVYTYGDTGYGKMSIETLLLDVLYDRNAYEPIKVLNITLNDFISSMPTSNLPVFYYYNRVNNKELITSQKVLKYMKNKLEVGMFPSSVVRNYCLKEKFNGNATKLLSIINDDKDVKSRKLKYIMSFLKENTDISPSDFRLILQKVYENDKSYLKESQFRRLIMYIDMLKKEK